MRKYPNKPYLAAFVLLSISFLAIPLFRSLDSVRADDGGGLTVSPSSLTFTAQAGGNAPPSQQVTVSGGNTQNFTVTTSAPWLTATPTSGTTPATLRVSVSPAGLSPGTYTGTVRIAAARSEAVKQVSVTFTVTAASRRLVVSPSTLAFSYQVGGTTPASQSLSVRSSTGSAVHFTVSVTGGGSWLSASPSSGTTPANVTVSVNPRIDWRQGATPAR